MLGLMDEVTIFEEYVPEPRERKSSKLLAQAREQLRAGEAARALRSAQSGLGYKPTSAEASELHRIIASVLMLRGENPPAASHAQSSLDLAYESEDYHLVCKSGALLGKILARLNRYMDAVRAWKQALQAAEEHDNPRAQGRILLNMAVLEQRRGKHERALEILRDAERRSDGVGDFRALAVCYSRMVHSYMELDRPRLAIRYGEKLGKLANRMGIKELIANANFRKGSIHLELDEFRRSAVLFKRAAALFRELDDKKNLAFVLCNLALAYIGMGRTKSVSPLLTEATELAKGVDSQAVLNAVNLVLAELAAHQGKAALVTGYYEEALRLAEAVQNEDRFLAFHDSLRQSLKKLGFGIPGLVPLLKRARTSYKRLGLKKAAQELNEWLAAV